MKIKAEYRDRVITVKHSFIPKGQSYRLGDLKVSELKALYAQGLIDDNLLEPKKTKKNEQREADKEVSTEENLPINDRGVSSVGDDKNKGESK